MASRKAIVKWLLESDPAIRWQVMRDLTDEPDAVVAAERSRVVSEGWGAQLFALQSPRGQWGADNDQGWMTTVDALALLKTLGVDPASAEARQAVDRVQKHITWWQLDGRPFFDGETEACINGRILAAGAYFGANCDRLVDRLLSEQLADGGWNCDAPPSQRSSFHSTICALEGLLEYEKAKGATASVTQAREQGQDYLIQRGMLRSLTSGELIDRKWMRFALSTMYHYDVLRGLDYLRNAGAKPDKRLAEATELVRKRSHQNGRWPLNVLYPTRLSFVMETGTGTASRWNTLRALRVLDWYETVLSV